MSCPHCQAAALSKAKFCRQCGSRIGVTCPACSATNPLESKFCGECGNSLITAATPGKPAVKTDHEVTRTHVVSQGERRHLTILFTDLTGYTRMMEKNDPEDVHALMASIIRSSVQIIKDYKGHIERIIGDEILALFGLPVAHEDDAIRAIKAAREIHATVMTIKPTSVALTDPVAMHTGINTGLVVATRAASSDGTLDLSGDAVNIASRLCDLAQPNEILVGPETYRQAYGFFNFDSKPALPIEGKSHSISIYAVRDEKLRPLTGKRKLNFYADMVGRRTELDQLHRAMRELHAGQGSIISIVGEAGTGKSRLLLEFEKQLADQRITWITGYAYAHTQQIPYYPLVGIVRRWLALEGSATAREMSAGIARRVGELLGPDAKEIPIIQGLIGQEVKETLGMSPEEWRKRLKST
ncbi:MAG: adenylate/guanylate cyclase domain-containing protein, partial [Desulfosarcina sp.]